MSYVIALVDRKNDRLYMCGDKRATEKDGTFTDDYEKVFKLKKDLFIGVTGNGALAMQLLERAKSLKDLSTNVILSKIEEMNDAPVNSKVKLNCIITGRGTDGELFLWSKEFNKEPQYEVIGKGQVRKFHSLSNYVTDEQAVFINAYFQQQIDETGYIDIALTRTFEEISKIDHTVSPTFDCLSFSIYQP